MLNKKLTMRAPKYGLMRTPKQMSAKELVAAMMVDKQFLSPHEFDEKYKEVFLSPEESWQIKQFLSQRNKDKQSNDEPNSED